MAKKSSCFGEKRQRFTIRKLSLGVCSVVIGSLYIGTSASADTVQPATDVESTAAIPVNVVADAPNGSEVAALRTANNASGSNVENDATETSTFERTSAHLGAVTAVTPETDKPNVFNIQYETGQKGQLSFYNDHIVRYHVVGAEDTFKETPDPSRPDRPAEILAKKLADFPVVKAPEMTANETHYIFTTDSLSLELNKQLSTLRIKDKRTDKIVVEELEPLKLTSATATQTLKAGQDTQYFGGGTQNGRFTHKGNSINIVNENNWVDGGVASPNPFYWTTDGYGVLRHTFRPGKYDFESVAKDRVITTHNENRFDAFYFVDKQPTDILKDYYELTGKPVVLPIFSLYPGHLNAYNRDYWVEVEPNTPNAVYFKELKKWYKEYQPNQLGNREGIRETLNGKPGDANYPFTARAIVDRYKENDMPLGWILVNDGYGAGYGQAGSLEGNIQNLREFAEYAKAKGVLTGLWTQSDLHPDPKQPPLLQRDLPNEVEKGLVRVLKTDVAWVGPGYSFGLNGIHDAANIMTEKGDNARPFIITLDGWGGTQRYGSIWTGDQTGGQWEYIRFHIPTYVGTGLSGQPNVGSDMDGIFGGSNPIINTRDFQWKTFTTLQLNMDGWGSNPKNPYAFDATTTDINRSYLKFKTALIPYSYSLGHAAQDGKPIVRAMFLEFPDDKINYTKAVNYQFMYGENLLVAPVYENVNANEKGNDVRNGIYLPAGSQWIDYYTGKVYEGGQTLENYDAPIWKLPLFVRSGAIIPMTTPHNNIDEFDRTTRIVDFYPNGNSKFDLVEDDGLTQDYTKGKLAKTTITSEASDGRAVLTIDKTASQYTDFTKNKKVQFNVNVSEKPTSVTLTDNGSNVVLTEVRTLEEFNKGTNVYFYDAAPNLNRWSTAEGAFHNVEIIKNPVLRVKTNEVDVTAHKLQLTLDGFKHDKPAVPVITKEAGSKTTLHNNNDTNSPTRIRLNWDAVANATSYELEVDGVRHTNIKEPAFEHKDLEFGSSHSYRVRAVVGDTYTPWSDAVTGMTKADPLALAVDDIAVTATKPAQGGTPLSHLVDKDVNTQYHSKWDVNALPESITLDLHKEYEIDKLAYVPRQDGGQNGMIKKARISFSTDGIHWLTYNQPATWATDKKTKEYKFDTGRTARYIRVDVEEAVGTFVSGNELLVFQVEGSKPRVVGDVTADGAVDDNDRVSLLNYAGLRRGIDSDFKGYVEVADLNHNDVIDAYDTHFVTRQLGEGEGKAPARAAGQFVWTADKATANVGDVVTYTLSGANLANVDAVNAAIKIDTERFTVDAAGITIAEPAAHMVNFSRIRQHGDGSTEAFVVLSNNKAGAMLNGNHTLATFKLVAKKAGETALTLTDPILVGSDQLPVAPKVSTDATATTPTEETVTRIPNERVQVTGADVYQDGVGVQNLYDQDTNTLTELKWDWEGNYVNGKLPDHITLPQDITFNIKRDNERQQLDSIEIVKRTPGNGTMTKYKVTAYAGDQVLHASPEQNVPFTEATVRYKFPEGLKADKVVLTVLEARQSENQINNRMLTLKDVNLYETLAPEKPTPPAETTKPAYHDQENVVVDRGNVFFADVNTQVIVQTSEQATDPEIRHIAVSKETSYLADTYAVGFVGRDGKAKAVSNTPMFVWVPELRDVKAVYRVGADGQETAVNFNKVVDEHFKGLTLSVTGTGTYRVAFNTVTEEISYKTTKVKNTQLAPGEEKVKTSGVKGERTYTTVNGEKQGEGIVTKEVVDEVIEYNEAEVQPEKPSQPADDKKPEEDKKPTDDKKPEEDKKPADDKKPEEDKKPADDKKPEEDKKLADDKQPKEHKVADANLTTPEAPNYDLNADDDADGYSNFVELVLGSNPNTKDSVPQPKKSVDNSVTTPTGEVNATTSNEVSANKPVAKPSEAKEDKVTSAVSTTVSQAEAELPTTGESDAYLIFGAAAMALLASVGLLPKRKENE